jgi:hypothetical protein
MMIVNGHEYTRKGRTKQWDDDSKWAERNNYCHKKNRQLFGMDGEVRDKDFGIYDFGKVRTLHDYEKYAGISFSKRAITQYTLDNNNPPNPKMTDEEFENALLKLFKHCIDIMPHQLAHNDYDFWVVAFENDKGETIYRQDADANEIRNIMNDPDGYYKIWRTFSTDVKPVKWVVWAHSISADWAERITGDI